jgi:ligand-binding sensor domain-containing protein
MAVVAQNNPGLVQVLHSDAIKGKPGSLLFSKRGFFYAGTSEGLFLFNGVVLRPLSNKNDSLQNITALYEDRKGVLWVGCANGSVYTFSNNKILPWILPEGHPQKGISAFSFDERDQLWMATKGEGVYVYSNSKLYNINTADGLSDDYVYDLQFINNQVIAATDQGISICSFNNGKKQIKVFNTSTGLADNIVQAIEPDPKQKNKVWLGFQNGNAGLFDLALNSFQNIYQANQSSSSVLKILPLDDEVWIADDNGINRINRKDAEIISNMLLPSPLDLSKDAEGNIWILNSNGFYRSSGEQLQPVISIPTDETNYINDIVVDDEGCFWLTAKGGVSCYKSVNKKYTGLFFPLPLKSKSDITCLYMEDQETIWMGTMGEGVFTLDKNTKKIKHLSTVPGIERLNILSITGTSQNIWINSLEGVWQYNRRLKRIEKFETASITGSAYIYYVFEDSKGRVWFATDGKGISVWENGRYTSFRDKEGLMAKVVYSLVEDKNGAVWCNTLNNGIYKYDGKKFIHFGKEQGLPDLNISSISADDNGTIFCTSVKECFVIDGATGIISTAASPTETGPINSNLNCSFSDQNKFWFHAGTHIYLYRRPFYKQVSVPQTRILNVQLFLNEVDTVVKKFAYNENNLSFAFAGFYYSDPLKVTYQYKLDGYNNQWQTTKDGFINFPKLLPGSHTFRVRSSVNGNFDTAKEAVFSFTISKPFWRTWWFLILSIATVTSILIFIIKTREAEAQKIQKLENEKLKSQYETLKSQVNPHFLFNSFNTLLNVIDEDSKKASVYVEHLSDFYRSIVNLREKDLIPLSEELKLMQHYFYIQQKRFGEALQLIDDVSPSDKETHSVPPLTLQLLAENAMKHNAVSKDQPLILHISIQKNNLIVQNNLNPKINHEKGEGLGLQNIKNRFLLIAGKEVTVEKTHSKFIVSLPLIKVS